MKTYEFCDNCNKKTHHIDKVCRVCNTDGSDLINWSYLSRLLCQDRTSISKNRVSEKHKESVEALKLAIKKWYADYVTDNKA